MRMLAALALLLAATPLAAQMNDLPALARSMGQGLAPDLEARAITAAAESPLGSRENPVRVDGPLGERAYLGRLRCPDGAEPAYVRTGTAGVGPYRFIIDDYAVTCRGPERVTHIFFDMYHHHVEARPVADFTITPPR